MAVPNIRRFVVEGTLPGGEKFAYSWAALGPAIVGANAQQTADAVVANSAFTAFLTATQPFANTGTTPTVLRCYFYANDGRLADAGAANTGTANGSGSNLGPNQAALCISLRTAAATRSGRGRMFIPCNGAATNSTTGKLSQSRTALATATAALMAYTVGQVASETQGVSRAVTVVRVGDVVDTIRARRNRLVESYVSAGV